MKIVSYNVNGIRSAIGKGLLQWINDYQPDVLCFQELKATPDQIPVMDFEMMGYHHYWFPAQKKGYSGVGMITKKEPDNVVYGMDNPLYDNEGRFLRADFGDLSVVSVYHPSGTTGDERQAFKMVWLDFFRQYVNELRKTRPQLVLSGDYNICHEDIDINNPRKHDTSATATSTASVTWGRSPIAIAGGASVPAPVPRTSAGASTITWLPKT